MNIGIYIMIALIIWNLIAFSLMGIDKYKAIKGKWRISEKKLLLCAFSLGGIGILLGMCVFRHKTKHINFRILVPIAAALNIAIFFLLFKTITK